MVVLQFIRLFKNGDVSSIAFEEYNSGPQNDYPTFTICFEEQEEGSIFYLPDSTDPNVVGKVDYQKYLKGLSEMNGTMNGRMNDIDYKNVTVSPDQFVLDFYTRDTKEKAFNTWTAETFVRHYDLCTWSLTVFVTILQCLTLITRPFLSLLVIKTLVKYALHEILHMIL